MTHTLKTWPQYFSAIRSKEKPFELRKADRLFNVGDTLVLQEFTKDGTYTGEEEVFEISYILWDTQMPQAIKKGYCILGLKNKIYDNPLMT